MAKNKEKWTTRKKDTKKVMKKKVTKDTKKKVTKDTKKVTKDVGVFACMNDITVTVHHTCSDNYDLVHGI